jgi:hypothetical protein
MQNPFNVDVPPVIRTGSPGAVDRYLRSALWRAGGNSLPLLDVIEWTNVLRVRGDDFASHVSACHFWLYERSSSVRLLLSAWRLERRARTAVRRSLIVLRRQRALVDRLASIGADSSEARALLQSMEAYHRAYCDVWETRLHFLDRVLRHAEHSD